jgi:phosphoglycolate phosphatase
MIGGHHRHVIWDWNGTLLDDLELCLDVINRILERHALPRLDRARYHEVFDFPVRGFYERIGLDVRADERFAELSHEFISTYDARRLEAALHPRVPSLLAAIAGSGRSQSILSAHRQTTLLPLLDHFGLRERFTAVAGLDHIHAHSKVGRGQELLAELALDPSGTLLVGDTLHDLEVAHALGVDCVLVACGHHSAERLRASGATVVEGLEALTLP